MAKKKRSIQETITTVIVDDVTSSEEDPVFTDLNKNLAEIRKVKGVVGYILRSTTSATIDLKEPEKIFEYAMLSSQMLDSSREISDLFNLGDVENILIEGKETKTLCMVIGENKISIFMEKNADHADILKRVLP
ncbi:MAG: roadblock/LC7 domain-containing protein [Candidatus Bathyarchaeota archaeon]|nr:MAG: roadblock/LC7 domain-containing protein [Candidatus Bathyarchaeota archaeon]